MVALTLDGQMTAASFNPSSTSGIIGTTTNNDAAAGSVGELISSIVNTASAVSLTTNTPANVTSISLTAGDWDVYGNISFIGDGTTSFTRLLGWTSLTSATVPGAQLLSGVVSGATATVSSYTFCGGFSAPLLRVSIASTTTVYLSAFANFSVSTLGACGQIFARRRR